MNARPCPHCRHPLPPRLAQEEVRCLHCGKAPGAGPGTPTGTLQLLPLLIGAVAAFLGLGVVVFLLLSRAARP